MVVKSFSRRRGFFNLMMLAYTCVESNGCAGRDWTNAITREAFCQVLEEWDDPMAIAREWLDVAAS
jgi:hypothetical protein